MKSEVPNILFSLLAEFSVLNLVMLTGLKQNPGILFADSESSM